MDGVRDKVARLAEKRDALVRIRELTAMQADIIAQDKTEWLLDCIGERQVLIDSINELDAWLEAHDPSDVPGYRSILEEMQAVLRDIAETDRKNELLARERIEFYKKNIREVSVQKKTNNAYERLVGFEGSAYLDKRN